MFALGRLSLGLQTYVPESDDVAVEMIRVTQIAEGDLSVIIETPCLGPEYEIEVAL